MNKDANHEWNEMIRYYSAMLQDALANAKQDLVAMKSPVPEHAEPRTLPKPAWFDAEEPQ